MPVNIASYRSLKQELDPAGVTLVAVSKTRPAEEIKELYELGHRDMGENYVQELVAKAAALPSDIRWHFIGHLQTNKVKLIVPVVQLVHSVDSLKLLQELNKQAEKIGKVIEVLLQVHIADEQTKFGFDAAELKEVFPMLEGMRSLRCRGLMGMATLTEDEEKLRSEFRMMRKLYDTYFPDGNGILSMGMSGDYKIAVEEGSNMVRIGSLVFGERH